MWHLALQEYDVPLFPISVPETHMLKQCRVYQSGLLYKNVVFPTRGLENTCSNAVKSDMVSHTIGMLCPPGGLQHTCSNWARSIMASCSTRSFCCPQGGLGHTCPNRVKSEVACCFTRALRFPLGAWGTCPQIGWSLTWSHTFRGCSVSRQGAWTHRPKQGNV